MCDDIKCEDLHLSRVARMDDTICEYRIYDNLNPECVRYGMD